MGAKYSTNKKGRIEHYWTLREKLGQGSFGTVRLCERKSDGMKAAVKIIRKRELSKKELGTLDREATILSKVEHLHTVRLYDIYDTRHHLYLIMELCEGGELFDAICENNFSEADAAAIIKQITEALIYLHKQGIVHRDLKPENLLYSSKKKQIIKLMDFGLAKALDSSDDTLETRCGTLHYVAPEVLSKIPYTYKCDFWSLGVILYVLLCGYLPFYHEQRAVTVKLVRAGVFEFDPAEWSEISPEAKDLISKLLTKDAEARLGGQQILDHPFLKNSVNSTRAFSPRWQESFKELNKKRQEENLDILVASTTISIQMNRWINKAKIQCKEPVLGEDAEEGALSPNIETLDR